MTPRLLVLCVSLVGCTGPDTNAPASTEARGDGADEVPTLTVVTADRTDLLFRYRGEDREATAQTIAEIPEAARSSVQVVDLARSPAERRAGRYVQVFDLRKAGADKRYVGRLVPRAELEAALAERARQIAAARPKQAPVTMYSAAWCGVCTKARRFLEKEGVAFTEKDVEKTPGAATELAAKAKKAGAKTGGVPVFDIGGQLVNGFDGPRILAMIRQEKK